MATKTCRNCAKQHLGCLDEPSMVLTGWMLDCPHWIPPTEQAPPETPEVREGVYRCPNGCDFEELELGVEGQSFHAVIGLPFYKVRCGKCGFDAEPKPGREEAIEEWNRIALEAAHGVHGAS